MDRETKTKGYMILVLVAGLVCTGLAIVNFPLDRIDLYFALLVAITIGLGTQVTIPIPQLKSHIAVSDLFVFLALIMFGGPVAMLLAGVEALISSWRFCSKKITIFFNASSAAISTAAVVGVLHAIGIREEAQLHGQEGYVQDFLIALSVMTIVYFFVNTTLAAIYDSISGGVGVVQVWKRKYLWSFITYFVGAAGAGILVQLSDRLGFVVIVATVPIILLLYASYRMYITTVRLSLEQAEQAEQYAKELEDGAAALRESEERFRRAFTNAPIGIALVGFDGRWLKVNKALCDLLGFEETELLASTFSPYTHRDDLFEVLDGVRKVMSGEEQSCQLEIRYLHRSGRTVWSNLSISVTDDAFSVSTSLIFQIEDITDKKYAAEKLRYEAAHDSLTGLANRATFVARLESALAELQANPKYQVSVLFIDLDRFKFVNDSLGHVIGDELLKAIAERLNSAMRSPDLVARLGGDEFVVLVEGRYLRERVTQIADRIQERISQSFFLNGHEVFTTASIGILNATEKHRSADDIIRDADTAMYQAKRSGKARHETFDEDMRNAVLETLRLETDLRRAIRDGEIRVYYQPIFCLADERIYALEALARWEHPELGTISPDRFVPLAEELGLMDELTNHVMRIACSRIADLRRALPQAEPVKLSINISSKQFGNEDILSRINQILEETAFPADRLKLEITETVFFEDHDRALEVLRQMRRTGIETDIDDFGTGYSNLGYLVRLPISTLKIDKSFVMMMDDVPANREVIRTVISLAASLGFKVVAEGIESEHHREVLAGLGCDYGQGYHFSRPLGPDLLDQFILGREEARYHIPNGDVAEATMIQ